MYLIYHGVIRKVSYMGLKMSFYVAIFFNCLKLVIIANNYLIIRTNYHNYVLSSALINSPIYEVSKMVSFNRLVNTKYNFFGLITQLIF